jgi:amidase
MSDLVFLPATEQLRLMRSRQLSAMELAEAHIAQIERLNPLLGALVDFDPDRVRAQARSVRAGSLAGLPVTIKSSIATAGYRCEIGSTLHRDDRPSSDAEAVAMLRRHGAIILGTTNCPEFLMAYETDNVLHGRTRNPWSLEHSAGGSSGGESSAIAAGMSAAGLGSDSGGSVRIPAHFTGICALKPTSGRISAEGHLPPCVGPFARLGAIGPMARSIPDVSLLFDLLATPSMRPIALEEARRIPIGYFDHDGFATSPEIRAAVEIAAETLRSAGFQVKPFRPEGLEDAQRLWSIFFVQCGARFYGPTIAGKHDALSPVFREFLSLAEAKGPLSSEDLLFAWAEWDLLCKRILDQMLQFPVLLLPPCAMPAFRHGERSWNTEQGQIGYLDSMRYAQWFNILGAPAAVVPISQTSTGLPVNVQIAGRPFEDERVLAIAAVLDREFGYRVPPVARPGAVFDCVGAP